MKVSTVFDFFPLIHLFLPRTCSRQNLLNAKFNVALGSDRTAFRKKQAQHNFHFRQFCFTKSTLIKKSRSSINFVRHFLAKQWNVLKIIDIRVA